MLILFSFPFAVLADEEQGSISGNIDAVNSWTVDMWKENFPNTDFTVLKNYNGSDLDYNLLRQRVEDFPNEFQVIIIKPTEYNQPNISDIFSFVYCFGNADNYQQFYLNFPSGYSDFDLGKYYSFVNNRFDLYNLSQTSGKYYYSVATSEFLNPSSKICICNSLEWYNYMVERAGNVSTDGLYYYDGNILQSFLDVVDEENYGQRLYDVSKVGNSGSFLYFYDCFDSPKGKYNYNYYEDGLTTDPMMNYLSSSVVFEDELYFVSDFNVDNHYESQHQENLIFYLKINDEDNYNLSYSENAQDGNKMTSEQLESWISDYIIQHTTTKHFERGSYLFVNLYSTIRLSWLKKLKGSNFSLHRVSKQGLNVAEQWQYYIKFTMPNSYTFVANEETGNCVFTGCRTATSAKKFNPVTGKVLTDSGGVGSNIDNADLGTISDKSDLLNDGWSSGYPNSSGNYSYCVTVNRNTEPFLKFYFQKKPKVHSYFYTDSQIKYTLDLSENIGYVYHVGYNISSRFDFTKNTLDDLKKSGTTLSNIVNAVSLGSDVASLAVESSSPYMAIVSSVFNFVQVLDGLGCNIDTIPQSYTIDLWTNYTGTLNSHRGYYTYFNWDIGVDGAFIRDNSDDTHNYAQDYQQDHAPGTEQPTESGTGSSSGGNTYNTWNYYYYDNNGNVHGGGDLTYIATEPPTASELFYQNTDFNFNAPTLWNYATNAMSFCKSAFTIFPPFIWLLIASGIVLVIALRLLGR